MTCSRFFSTAVRPRRLLGLAWIAVLTLTFAVEHALLAGVPEEATAAILVDFAQGGPLPAGLLGDDRRAEAGGVDHGRAEALKHTEHRPFWRTPTHHENLARIVREATAGGRSSRLVRAKAQAVGLLRHDTVRTTLEDLYQVDPEDANKVWAAVLKETKGTSVNPLLMMAVIAQESRFDPNAVSHAGAKGLTQVIPRWHREKLNPGDQLTSIPVSVRVGVHVLNDYLKSTDGNVILALQKYNGASKDRSHKYAREVFLKEQTLAQAILERSDASLAFDRTNHNGRHLF